MFQIVPLQRRVSSKVMRKIDAKNMTLNEGDFITSSFSNIDNLKTSLFLNELQIPITTAAIFHDFISELSKNENFNPNLSEALLSVTDDPTAEEELVTPAQANETQALLEARWEWVFNTMIRGD